MTPAGLTGSQTVGPFFAMCLTEPRRPDALKNVLVQPNTVGEHIRIEGQVLDGDRNPIPDALVEIWQANAHGRYNHPADTRPVPLDPAFTGYGRSDTENDGNFWFETIKPGAVPFTGNQMQAPHLVVTVASRGMLNHAVTRLYFADDPATESDPVLASVPADRRATLLARRHERDGKPIYLFDIVLQGEGETAFFQL